MAAVRELGGRFLELDERTNIYRDIGDKKATEKTSQALREGQTKIRKQLYKDEEKAGSSGFDTSLMGGSGVPMPSQREISAEGYFGYSVQVLESLYNSEEMGLTVILLHLRLWLRSWPSSPHKQLPHRLCHQLTLERAMPRWPWPWTSSLGQSLQRLKCLHCPHFLLLCVL